MTRVDFHFNAPDKIGYGCRLIRKIYRTGTPVLVYDDDTARLSKLDQALWTFSALDFIPHVLANDPLAKETPVVLTSDANDAGRHQVLVNLSNSTPPVFSRFERLIEVVSTHDDDRAAARERWRFYKDRGYPIERHDLGASQLAP